MNFKGIIVELAENNLKKSIIADHKPAAVEHTQKRLKQLDFVLPFTFQNTPTL